MGEHVTSRPPEANSEASSQHGTGSRRLLKPLRRQLVKASSAALQHRRLAGRGLPALDRDVDVDRADLDRADAPAGLLAGDDLRAGTTERLETDLARPRVLAHRQGEYLDRLRRRMVGLLADLDGRDIPDGARVIVGDAGRLVAPEPAEEARFVLPEIVRAR